MEKNEMVETNSLGHGRGDVVEESGEGAHVLEHFLNRDTDFVDAPNYGSMQKRL